ncbi:MAG: HAD family hydrolase [Treponema sp.]|nr:HAD family hydrolase [Treponema sp.]
MKTYNLPEQCNAILFDIDSTLYTHPEYARLQLDLPVKELARLRGISFKEMNDEIARFREDWAREHDGQVISLGNIFKAFGISIGEIVRWREQLFNPEQFLAEDMQLRSVLKELDYSCILAAVTNNPVSVAERTLRTLGVEDLFHAIIGLDTCGVSKPHEKPFMQAAILCGAVPENCISVGDRYDIDIALPLELGMGGILVDGVKDVYKIPDVLFGG